MRRIGTAAVGSLALVFALSGAAQALVVEARPDVKKRSVQVTATHRQTVTHTQPGRSRPAPAVPQAGSRGASGPSTGTNTNVNSSSSAPATPAPLGPIWEATTGVRSVTPAGTAAGWPGIPAPAPNPVQGGSAQAAQVVPAAQQVQEPTVTVTEVIESAVDQIDLTAPDLGASPCLADANNCTGTVGVPVWLWVDDGDSGGLPSESASASAGPYSIDATATVSEVKWSLGDGQTTICEGAGTEFNADTHGWSAPDCGFEEGWKKAGTYTLTASYVWDIAWSGDESGSASSTLSTTQEINVREIQTVVTGHDK